MFLSPYEIVFEEPLKFWHFWGFQLILKEPILCLFFVCHRKISIKIADELANLFSCPGSATVAACVGREVDTTKEYRKSNYGQSQLTDQTLVSVKITQES